MNEKRELLASPQIVPYDKRMKMANSPRQEEDAFDEPTGMFSDMMAEYKQNLAGPTKKYNDDHETSLQASFVDPGTRDRTGCNSTAVHGMETSGAHSKTGLNMTGAPNFNTTGAAPNFNMTGAAPNFNVTGAAPSLNMTGAAPSLNMTGAAPSLNVTAGVPNLDMTSGVPHLNMTEAAPALDLSGAPEDLAELTSNLSLDDTLDPFHPNTHAKLLSTLPTPISSMHGYVAFDGRLPQVRVKSMLTLGEDVFYVSECK